MRTLLILPTYNERENIEAMLGKVCALNREAQLGLRVLVLDDNSPDGTGDLVANFAAKNPEVILVRRPGKMGLGSAYRAGFQYAIDHGFEAVIQMDSDFSHDPQALREHVRWLRDYDIVVGARYIPGGSTANWNFWRRALSQGANLYSRLTLGVPVHDMTGGFNAYRVSALQTLEFQKVQTNGYAFQIQMKYRAHRRGLRFKEFPITFIDRRYGVSKIPRFEVPLALLRVLKWRLQPFK